MSKALEATCVAGVVTSEGVPVPDTTILSEGVAASEGLLILDEDKKTYIPKTSPDLKETLDKIVSVLGQISSALSALDTAGFLISATMGVPSPPVAASEISAIDTLQSELEDLKDNLR